MKTKMRIISANHTPMPSKWGWLVVDSAHSPSVNLSFAKDLLSVLARLEVALTQEIDYKVMFYNTAPDQEYYDKYSVTNFRRIVFLTEDALIFGKLCT